MAPDEMKSHLQLALASVRCFMDDGTLDMAELNYLLGIATADGVVDEDEKRVLRNIFAKVDPEGITPEVEQRIRQIRAKYVI